MKSRPSSSSVRFGSVWKERKEDAVGAVFPFRFLWTWQALFIQTFFRITNFDMFSVMFWFWINLACFFCFFSFFVNTLSRYLEHGCLRLRPVEHKQVPGVSVSSYHILLTAKSFHHSQSKGVERFCGCRVSKSCTVKAPVRSPDNIAATCGVKCTFDCGGKVLEFLTQCCANNQCSHQNSIQNWILQQDDFVPRPVYKNYKNQWQTFSLSYFVLSAINNNIISICLSGSTAAKPFETQKK